MKAMSKDILDNINDWRDELESVGPDFIKDMNDFKEGRYSEVEKYLCSIFNLQSDGTKEFEYVMMMFKRFFELGYYSGIHFGLTYEPSKDKNEELDNII